MSYIYSRSEWGAPNNRIGHSTGGAKLHVWVHHSVAPRPPCGASLQTDIDAVRQVASDHTNRFGIGPGYTFIITQSGRIFEGTGWGRIGAHTRNRNSQGYGICFFVDGRTDRLTPAAIEAFRWLKREGVNLGHLHPSHDVQGHSDVVATLCPGTLVYNELVAGRAPVPSGPDAATPMPSLRLGKGGRNAPADEREAVMELQRRLVRAGFMTQAEMNTGPGTFGPRTDTAVRDFQRSRGLVVDGIVGPKTWGALR